MQITKSQIITLSVDEVNKIILNHLHESGLDNLPEFVIFDIEIDNDEYSGLTAFLKEVKIVTETKTTN